MLPGNVLIEIFDFYRGDPTSVIVNSFSDRWWWKTLTQVCRKWRNLVFTSPRRLGLRVVCSDTTPTRTSLDIWPPFPIIVICLTHLSTLCENGVENLVAALKHYDRTCEIYVMNISGSALEKLATMMNEPFPALTDFALSATDESAVVFTEKFLGGSAPLCLRSLNIRGIPFPTFPTFILSATHLVDLNLLDIPTSSYVSPDVMATCLATLPNLKHLSFGFRSPLSRPAQINPSPLTRNVLPTLAHLSFSGVSEYLEDFLARIDTPLLNRLVVAFFMDLIFDIPRLNGFARRIGRSKPFKQARIEFSGPAIKIMFGSPTRFALEIRCEKPDWQLSSIVQVFSQQLPILSHVERLELRESPWEHIRWKDDPDLDPLLWLELFHLFIAVQSLYVSEMLIPPIAAAFEKPTAEGITMGVLPVLRNLFLEGFQPSGPVYETMKSFIATCQLSGYPIAIQDWVRSQGQRESLLRAISGTGDG